MQQAAQRFSHSRLSCTTPAVPSLSTSSPLLLRGTWRLHAFGKSTPTSNVYQAAALDVERQLRPAGGLRGGNSFSSSSSSTLLCMPASEPAQQGERPAQHITVEAGAAAKRYIHAAFGAFFCYLAAVTAAATNTDWYLDAATFGALWAVLWAVCARLQPSANTVALLCLLPVMHLSGALGMYHWELGNLSWDVLVHTTNGFIGTLLFASVLNDTSSAGQAAGSRAAGGHDGAEHSRVGGSAAAQQQQQVWRERAVGVLKVTALLLLSTSLVEVVEAAGGQLAGHTGEGIFLRGPGDYCTAALPCSEEVDSLKDMVDNCEGMMLALLALATRGSGSAKTSTHA